VALKFITNSLVVNGPTDGSFLSRTPGAPTDSNRWTLSVWFKRSDGIDNVAETLFSAGTASTDHTSIQWQADDTIRWDHIVGGSQIQLVITAARVADPTSWSHLVVRYDSDEAVSTDRIRFWLDNVQLVDFSSSGFPGSGVDTFINVSGEPHEIARRAGSADREYAGYLAEMYFCDGQVLSPTDFAERNTEGSNSWQPITASPTFGAEGWFLEFGTGADLGDDTSGNVNDWLENSIVAANQRDDSPTQNHLTWHPTYHGTGIATTDGGLALTGTTGFETALATASLPKTGKYYWECNALVAAAADRVVAGVVNQFAGLSDKVGNDNSGWGLYNSGTTVLAVRHDSADANFTDIGTFQTGDYAMVAFDADTGNLWFGLNGTFLDSGDPGLGLLPHVTLSAADIFGGELIPAGSTETIGTILEFRAGAEDFEGTIPNGFRPLRVDQWPRPGVLDPRDFFDTISYVGDDANPRSLTGLAFQPGFAWVKATDEISRHILTNSVVGGGTIWVNEDPFPDDASSPDGDIAALTPDGITVDQVGGSAVDVNDATSEYIGLFWKEDPAGGFDVVGYAGVAAPQTVSHSLGAVPDVMYVRHRNTALDFQTAYHGKRIDAAGAPITDPETDYLEWSTAIASTDSSFRWDDTAPTDADFTVGSSTSTNSDGADHMAMLWTEVPGLSKFTSYRGTGADNSESPFIYCGFKPKLIWVKPSNDVGNWLMMLSDDKLVSSVDTPAGGTSISSRFVSDEDGALILFGPIAQVCGSGFKIVSGFSGINSGTEEFMVLAFAEIPFSLKSAFSNDRTGDGAMDLKMVLEGQGSNPNRHGDGAMDFGLQIDGQGNNGGRRNGDGAVEPFGLVIDATGTNDKRKRGAAAVDMAFVLEGQARNRAIRGAAITPSQLTTNGQILQSHAISGTVTTPRLTTNGFMPTSIFSTGSARLPILTTNGTINPVNEAVLPAFGANGTVIGGTVNRGLFALPQIQPSGTLINVSVATGTARLPLLQVLGTILQGAAVSAPGISVGPLGGGMTLPALEANGFLLVPQEMAGTAITLPVIDIGPLSLIAPGSVITGSAILPTQRLDIVLVNAATLVATVWSMNTETLETTNYLNFDFVSLVSFADQPYGVTAGGIFLLEGDDDDGTNIDARILTGISDRGDEALKEASHMYMQYDGGAMMFQLLADGQQRLREYRFERRSNSSGVIHARAKGSRGLRSRSWQMGLRNLGGDDFLLDKLGLLLRILTRNTRKN